MVSISEVRLLHAFPFRIASPNLAHPIDVSNSGPSHQILELGLQCCDFGASRCIDLQKSVTLQILSSAKWIYYRWPVHIFRLHGWSMLNSKIFRYKIHLTSEDDSGALIKMNISKEKYKSASYISATHLL